MTIILPSCITCTHFHKEDKSGNFCDAFPDKTGIPFPIWHGDNDHTKPFIGDRGIQYEPFAGTPIADKEDE